MKRGRGGESSEDRTGAMARGGQQQQQRSSALFFGATMVLWSISVVFEISFNGRRDLLAVVGGLCFYQGANWIVRRSLSRDPLFVNTSVSLLHSTVTSASGDWATPLPQLHSHLCGMWYAFLVVGRLLARYFWCYWTSTPERAWL